MKLLLSSDGKTAIENIEKVSNIPLSKLNIAWIITASKTDENSSFLNLDLQEFLHKGIKPIIYDIKGKKIETIKNELSSIDIIFVEGGNTFYLLKAIRESGFDKFLKEWVQTKPYIGVSAGSYIACRSVAEANICGDF